MESATVLRSFRCSIGSVLYTRSLPVRSGIFSVRGKLISSSISHKGALVTCMKTSETTSPTNFEDSIPQRPLDKITPWRATFPTGFETLILEVCDETEVAELKLKVRDFEMHLKRSIGAAQTSSSSLSPTIAPPIPSEPMIESVRADAASPSNPPKSSSEKVSPFVNVASGKSAKLEALEASSANGYVLVSSTTVGSFRRGRTFKGKNQPPICKEGDIIKEGQVIGFLDQFGTELPVKSNVAGEVLKLLLNDGEAVGYGDPLIAVLPSFHGIMSGDVS